MEGEFKSSKTTFHRRGSSNVWNRNDPAKEHFIDSFMNLNNFSLPFKNGKPLKLRDLNKNKIPGSPAIHHKTNLHNNIGTAKNSNLGIKNRKFSAEVFATRYEPDVIIEDAKNELEQRLYIHTGEKHIVNVEKLRTKYDHYSSFKITCICSNTAVFMNSTIWPDNVYFKWWRGKIINS